MAETDTQDTAEEVSPAQDGKGDSSLISGNVVPIAATALSAAAAGLAVAKGPDLVRKLKGGAQGQAEDLAGDLGRKGASGLRTALSEGSAGTVGKVASKLMPGGGGTGKGGKTRRLPIQRWTDVAVPIDKAYEQWTKFEEFPKFMHRVLEVKEEEQGKLHWQEKIWFSTREWDAEIVDQRKNDRIAWKTTSGTQHSGVISFHKLDSNLTRVLVTVDFVPTGMIEKMASGLRFAKRAVQSDLARFKAYVELGEAKDLEYSSKPQEMEQHREGGDESDESEESDSEESEATDSADDAELESKRQERESRRKERRESVASS